MSALLLALVMVAPAADDAIPKETQLRVVQATVHIVNESGRAEGSGVLLLRQKSYAYILTAQHVVDRADRLLVETFTDDPVRTAASYREVKVLAADADKDVAVLRVKVGDDKLPAPLALCPLKEEPTGKDFPALVSGCALGKPPRGIEVRVVGKKRITPPGQAARNAWEMVQEPALGRSGGPLVDSRGYVIGVVSGAGDGKGYATHVEEVRRFLKENVLDELAGKD